MKTLTVEQLLTILKGVDPKKLVKMDVLLEYHPSKSHLEVGLIDKVKVEDESIWLYSYAKNSTVLYAADGFETIPAD